MRVQILPGVLGEKMKAKYYMLLEFVMKWKDDEGNSVMNMLKQPIIATMTSPCPTGEELSGHFKAAADDLEAQAKKENDTAQVDTANSVITFFHEIKDESTENKPE
jgi:hypothetical protein